MVKLLEHLTVKMQRGTLIETRSGTSGTSSEPLVLRWCRKLGCGLPIQMLEFFLESRDAASSRLKNHPARHQYMFGEHQCTFIKARSMLKDIHGFGAGQEDVIRWGPARFHRKTPDSVESTTLSLGAKLVHLTHLFPNMSLSLPSKYGCSLTSCFQSSKSFQSFATFCFYLHLTHFALFWVDHHEPAQVHQHRNGLVSRVSL